jgi:hypothetical protein
MRSLDDIERALKVGSLILVRGDHVGETLMVRPLLARLPRWGLRSWKPKPVGHLTSSSESACGAIMLGVVRAFLELATLI